jgi:hypothetical protein
MAVGPDASNVGGSVRFTSGAFFPIQDPIMSYDLFSCVKNSPEYAAIVSHYGTATTKRSKVPLINHINEGIQILQIYDATFDAAKAYCLHPLFQNDEDLGTVGLDFIKQYGHSQTVFLAMEYRYIANSYLANCSMPLDGINLGPLPEVKMMLVADKVQNFKDFEKYHLGMHLNGHRLDEYFRQWLDALGLTYTEYQQYCSMINDN